MFLTDDTAGDLLGMASIWAISDIFVTVLVFSICFQSALFPSIHGTLPGCNHAHIFVNVIPQAEFPLSSQTTQWTKEMRWKRGPHSHSRSETPPKGNYSNIIQIANPAGHSCLIDTWPQCHEARWWTSGIYEAITWKRIHEARLRIAKRRRWHVAPHIYGIFISYFFMSSMVPLCVNSISISVVGSPRVSRPALWGTNVNPFQRPLNEASRAL